MNTALISSTSSSRPVSKKRRNSNPGGTDAIKVLCRFRPFRGIQKDHFTSKDGKHKFNVDSFKLDEETGDVRFISDFQDGKNFKFDKVFGVDSTQSQIFGEISTTVDSVMDGFNGAVLAYGQTSAGKSWTMDGPSIWDSEFQGVVPRAVDKLFEDIEKAPSTIQFQIIVSYYEIYCEKDVTEVFCTDKENVLRVIEMGKTNRIAAPTLMNAESSRSHSIFSILVDQQDTSNGRHKKGVLYLVDLAGSEKVGKTGAKGLRLEEAKNINSSLTSLGMVINSLSDGTPHVPYRDSKLTMLLMEALGGNSKTTLIICCNPEHDHSPETLSTLRFGERAKHIKTNAKVNEELSASELKVLLTSAKKELTTLVGVLGKTSVGVGEAITASSTAPLLPIAELLKKCLAKQSFKLDRSSGMGAGGEPLILNDSLGATPVAGTEEEGTEGGVGTGEEDNSVSTKQPRKNAEEELADLQARMGSLEEEVELEKLKVAQEHEKCMFKDTEVSALQATIAELEEKLVKASLQAKRAQEAKLAAEELLGTANAAAEGLERERVGSVEPYSPTRPRYPSVVDVSALSPVAAQDIITPNRAVATAISPPTTSTEGGADAQRELTAKERREFLVRLERELITTGTQFEKDGSLRSPSSPEQDPLKNMDRQAVAAASEKDNEDMMKFLNIKEEDLAKSPTEMDSEGNRAMGREAYENHVRRLMFILDQEQQARLRVEDKLEDARQQLFRQSSKIIASGPPTNSSKGRSFLHNLFGSGSKGSSTHEGTTGASGSTSSNPLTTFSNMVADTISPARRLSGSFMSPTAEENARRFNYNDRESALAETLEIAQERIMELVGEMESNKEAHTIVLETKESVLRSLARQNTHLAMERDTLNQKVEALTAKTEQLSTLLRSVQQAQMQVQQPAMALPKAGLVGSQSFRIGSNGSLQRFGSSARIVGAGAGGDGDSTGKTVGGGSSSVKTAPSFRMGGKPPITPTAAASSLPTASGSPIATGGFIAPRAPFFFSGAGSIQRSRPITASSSTNLSASASPINVSGGSSVSSSSNSSSDDLVLLESSTGLSPQNASIAQVPFTTALMAEEPQEDAPMAVDRMLDSPSTGSCGGTSVEKSPVLQPASEDADSNS